MTEQEKLDQIFKHLEDAEKHYNEEKGVSMLHSIHEAKQALRRYIEPKDGDNETTIKTL